MIGWIVLLVLTAFLSLFGAAMLMVACWVVNRILGTPAEDAVAAQLAGPAQVYRPVDAGPYTSPSTGHDGPTGHGPATTAVPSPTFLHALAIVAPTVLVGGLATCGLGGVVWFFSSGSSDVPWPMVFISLFALGTTFVVHVLLLAWLLPTTPLRALLLAGLEAVPMGLVGLALAGFILFSLLAVRSGPPPPATPSPARAVPVAPVPPTTPASQPSS